MFFKDSIKSKGALAIIEKSTRSIIGSSRYKRLKGENNSIEIGWSFLARKYWGGVYNKAMKSLMIEHAFLFVDEVVLFIGPENIRSQKAVEKIGGKRVFNRPELLSNNNNWIYRIRKDDWRPAN